MTKIAWTDETWNPVTGCTKISAGCKNCYAERMARRLAGRYGYPEAPNHFDVTLHPDKLDRPLRWKKPRRVFVCSMGDLFHTSVAEAWIEAALDVIAKSPQHTFQILTKRPAGMGNKLDWLMDEQCARFDDIFPNVWLGTSIENQEQADKRTPDLLRTPAAVRFVSVEPMLGPVDLERYICVCAPCWRGEKCGSGLQWVIIGCESGPNRRPMQLEWALDLVRQCDAAQVPVFVKQIPVDGRVSHDPNEWPEELQRREYPK